MDRAWCAVVRLVYLLGSFAACTGYGAVTIESTAGPPLGVGLVERLAVTQELCEGGVDPGGCDPWIPNQLSAEIQSGDAAVITDVVVDQLRVDTVGLRGIAPGEASVEVTAVDGATASATVDVAEVASSALWVRRLTDDGLRMYPDAVDPVQVFWSSSFPLAQRNLGADGSPRTGSLVLDIDRRGTDLAYGPDCDCYSSGFFLGAATLSSPLVSLTVDVVDERAVADVTINGRPATTEVALIAGGSAPIDLVPIDTAGRPIVGHGRDPEIAIADASIATVYQIEGRSVVTAILLATHAGTTTMTVTWGPIRKTFAVRVTTS
jgi:hypothetical protein